MQATSVDGALLPTAVTQPQLPFFSTYQLHCTTLPSIVFSIALPLESFLVICDNVKDLSNHTLRIHRAIAGRGSGSEGNKVHSLSEAGRYNSPLLLHELHVVGAWKLSLFSLRSLFFSELEHLLPPIFYNSPHNHEYS